ncbi:MAG: hypothetical protein CL916_03895 [Deltaproteobacteria bacterium]|nr:hypothetical protein [Deltaproteobacteria bacterium]
MSFISFITFFTCSIANANPSIELLEQQYPQEFARLQTLAPLPTRAGHLRFIGSDITNVQWAPLFLNRYMNATESTEVRRALLDLLYRSLGEIPDEIISSYSEEPDTIRSGILEMTDFGTIDPNLAQKDTSPLVRATFIRQVAKSSQASNSFILYALQDNDPMVLADAARAAYQKECSDAIPHLASLVTTDNHVVALRSLYALSKLDLSYARSLIQKHNLTESANKNLALFAKGL